MKRKFFTFLMAFLATVGNAVWAETYTLESMSGEYTINGGTHTISGTATQDVRFTITEDATITLQDAHFAHSRVDGLLEQNASPLHINNNVSLTLILEGDNSIESKEATTLGITDRAAGIYVPEGAKLIVAQQSTGQLTVTGRVAIGTNLFQMVGNGACGEIDIQGGTVVAVGDSKSSLPSISLGGGSILPGFIPNTGSVKVSGNGVLVAAQEVNVPDRDLEGGIVFEASTEGYVKGTDVTLQSPLDLDNLTLHVESGHTLTLAKGYKIDNAEGLSIDGGTVNGYKILYTTSIPSDVTVSGIQNEVPSMFYCGPETQYDVRDWHPNDGENAEIINVNEVGQYQHIDGWWYANGAWTQVSKATTGSETASIDAQGHTITHNAAWIVNDRNLVYQTGTGLTSTVNLWYPADAPFTATTTTQQEMTEAGLQISGNQLVNTDPVSAQYGTHVMGFNLTSSNGSGPNETARVTANVGWTPIAITDESVSFKLQSGTYNGNEYKGAAIVEVYINDGRIEDNQYKVAYKKDGGDWSDWDASITDAGSYTIKVAGAGSADAGAFTTDGEQEVEGTFTIEQAKLTVEAAKSPLDAWNILDTDKKPTLTDNIKIKSGKVGQDDVTVTAGTATVTLKEGEGTADWNTTPGTYTVTLSSFTLAGNDKDNYKVTPESITFDFTVYKQYSEDDDIEFPTDLKPGEDDDEDNPFEWNDTDKTFEYTYNGNAIDIQTITFMGEIVNYNTNATYGTPGFTVSYAAKNGSSLTDNKAVNVGNYTDTFNIYTSNGVFATNIPMPFRITPATLTAEAAEVTWMIGESGPNFTDKLSLTGTIYSQDDETDEVTVTGTNPTGEWKVAGTYTVTYTDLNLTGTDAGNYKLSSESVEGTLIVSKSGSLTPGEGDDGEIKIEDEDGGKDGWTLDADGNGYTRVYDGQSHKLNTDIIKVKQHTEEGDTWVLLSTLGGEVEISYTNDESTSVEEPKNADTYTATITIKENEDGIYSNATATIKLTIEPKEVTVPIKDFTAADVVGQTEMALTSDNINWDEVDLVGEESLSASGTVTFTSEEKEGETTYKATFSNLKLENGATGDLASNYDATFKYGNTILTDGAGESDVTVDKIEGEISLPSGEWTKEEDGTYSRVYDGKTHNITSIAIGEENAEVTSAKYMYTAPESSDAAKEVTDVKDAGTYVATITTSQGTAELTLKIEPKELTITINDQTIEVDGTGFNNSDFTVKTGIENETVTVEGTLTYTTPVEAGTVYTGAITVEGSLSMNPDNKNYTIPTNIAGGDLTVKAEKPSSSEEDPIVDPDDPKLEGIVLEGWENLSHVYDGEIHGLTNLTVTLTNGEETTIGVSTKFTPSDVKNVGTYTAAIKIENGGGVIETGTFYVQLAITKRPMQITFQLPATIENTDPMAITADHLNPEAESADRGLLKKEAPLAVESGQFIFGKPNAQGECSVSIRNFKLDDTDKFLANNYQVQIWNPETGEWEDYDPNSGEDVTIIDPDSDYADENPNNPGGGDSGVVVDPDGSGDDDDDHNPGHGGSDINRPAKYYNMYVDTAATCDGVELWFNKNVVREGNQASVYVKIEEGYDAEHMKLWFKRSLYGYWEELEEGVQPGEYIIYNVYTDIYVKATDVEKDPTGIEEIEGVKVYAQNGSIYVYTPNRLPVWIVSMTGAVVRNEEQVGLQQYDRLNQGIYIVRVGEQVFKIRL